MSNFARRSLLKIVGFGSALMAWPRLLQGQETNLDTPGTSTSTDDSLSWADTNDRVFLSGDCWANPMEDWIVKDGAIECTKMAVDRTVHRVTHQLTNPAGDMKMSVVVSRAEINGLDGGAGFRIGVKSDLNEYRSNCFAKSGIEAGVRNGALFIGKVSKPIDELADPQEVSLSLIGQGRDGQFDLTITAKTSDGTELGSVSTTVLANQVLGNVALISSFGKALKRKKARKRQIGFSRYRFNDWSISGDAFTVTPEHRFGPLLWSMYTLSDSRGDAGFVLKLSALTGPLGEKDNHDVELMVKRSGEWKSVATAELDSDAWVATFRIANWDQTRAADYKVVYREQHPSGKSTTHEWAGNIKANPAGRPLRMAALTCQKDYGFPYEPVAKNLLRLDPDLLYFSGDQIYEDHGGYGSIRKPADRAILNYLRKYYQHGWSFRESMKDAPTVCLPDDHDVFQGNLWGEAGMPMANKDNGASSFGGYIEPAKMVNAVHKTTVSHHPDPYDATPVEQGISVYYGDMVYGDVGFAILADRQFKSGPEHVDTGEGRADHVSAPDFDTAALNKPGLKMLGDRQETFLKQWADDWRGHSMKVLLSQTVFAGMATHHGDYDGYLKADLDSNAWPQAARKRAIKIATKAMPLHINGDQHLTSLTQYGIESQRDSFWSFCTPAISVGYPRWWRPDEMEMAHQNRPAHGIPHTGEYLDGCGNMVYVYAVGNPEVGTKKHRYELAHQKGSGFGFVTIDSSAKTYFLESFRFMVDATNGKPSNQFPGWPVTIHQEENAGKNRIEIP